MHESQPCVENNPLRILHVIATADPASGGPIEGVLRQDEATRMSGIRELATTDLPSAAYIADLGLKVHALGTEKRFPIFSNLLSHYGYTPHLIPWLKRNRSNYDAIIVNGLWNFSTFASACALPGHSTPYFVFPHGMMDPWFRTTYPLKHLAKIFFWLAIEGRLLAGARRVFFTSEEEMRLARGQFPLWRYRGRVVGYGTAPPPAPSQTQRAAFRSLAPAVGDRPYLLFLSRIHRKKGCDLLIDGFAAIARQQPDLQLVVAGPDQEGLVGRLKERASALGVADRVHWPGMLKGDAKWGAYRGAEAFVLPSHQENFGIVVAEALACKLPVLITNKVNIWREVDAARAGIVRSDDMAGVHSLLSEWLSLSAEDRVKMREAALATFEQHFNVNNVAPALIETIEGTL